MATRGANRSDGRKRRQTTKAKPAQKRARHEPELEEPERIQLSVQEGDGNRSEGNVRLPLVENMFDIEAILKETETGKVGDDAMTLGLTFGDEMPPDILKCAEDDLSAHVPHQLKEKIWSHKYINLALLLKGNAELSDIFSGGLLHVSDDGKIQAKPRQSKETVASIEQWTDAFLIFCSIYVVRYPDKVQELYKYMSVIRDSANKFPSKAWRLYDEQFRTRQAIRIMNWGQINADLWLRIMSSSSNSGLPSVLQSNNSSNTNTCRYFNRGSCTYFQCRYKHACDLCGSSFHGMVRCQAGKSQESTNRSNFGFRGYRPRFRGYNRGFPSRGRGFQGGSK